jgi:fatty acid amide hydrolase
MTALTARPQSQANDITSLGAGELAALIANGDLSSSEVVEAHIARIERVNPKLNAVVWSRFDAARAEAREADQRRAAGGALGVLHGVPVTIKECLDVAGSPSTFGIASRAGHRAERDEAHVARLREAGAIVLGKTNVAQLLMYYESDNPLYGRTNNPWNLDRAPGGSSGGEAAIIAAGGSPLGLGTDIGGSVRIPAHFSGLASLKPTAGRTPDLGRFSIPLGQGAIASQVGVLARQVVDVALGLEAITAKQGGQQPVGTPGAVDLSRLRVAYFETDGTFPAAPGVRRAVREAAAILARNGAQVTAWQLPEAETVLGLFFGIVSADGGRYLKTALNGSKADPRIAQIQMLGGRSRRTLAVLGGLLRLLGQQGMANGIRAFGHRDTAHYWQLVEAQHAYRERFLAALDTADGGPFDVILSPACSLPAFTHGASADLVTAGPYAILYNVLGYPAGVVPVTRVRPGEESERPASRDKVVATARKVEMGSAGLPLGVQVAARPWQEHIALAAMQVIEAGAREGADYPATPVM